MEICVFSEIQGHKNLLSFCIKIHYISLIFKLYSDRTDEATKQIHDCSEEAGRQLASQTIFS